MLLSGVKAWMVIFMIYIDCRFLLILIIYATTIRPASIETKRKKVPSSLTVPLGKTANNVVERNSNILNHCC